MDTKEILLKLEDVNDTSFTYPPEDFYDLIGAEATEKLVLVDEESTNPRRDYNGTLYTFKNNFDEKYIQIEVLETEMESSLYYFGEAVAETKTVTVYNRI